MGRRATGRRKCARRRAAGLEPVCVSTFEPSVRKSGIDYVNVSGEPEKRYNYGGKFKDVGFFAEDMIHIGDRATVQIGVRYDRVEAISEDVQFMEQDDRGVVPSGQDVAGLGTLYTNNNIAPRIGFNIKLDDEGKTVLRGNWGLYFRQPITGEIGAVHPGNTTITTAFYDPATDAYTDIVDVFVREERAVLEMLPSHVRGRALREYQQEYDGLHVHVHAIFEGLFESVAILLRHDADRQNELDAPARVFAAVEPHQRRWMKDEQRHAFVLSQKSARDPVQIRQMAHDHHVLLQARGLAAQGVDVVIGSNAAHRAPRTLKDSFELLRCLHRA